MNHTSTQRNEATRTRYQERLAKALQYIEDNLDQSLRLEDIAAASYFSPFHFHRTFTDVFGLSPARFARQIKIEKARRLLLGGQYNVKQVAARRPIAWMGRC